jgi:hypothetical protein
MKEEAIQTSRYYHDKWPEEQRHRKPPKMTGSPVKTGTSYLKKQDQSARCFKPKMANSRT